MSSLTLVSRRIIVASSAGCDAMAGAAAVAVVLVALGAGPSLRAPETVVPQPATQLATTTHAQVSALAVGRGATRRTHPPFAGTSVGVGGRGGRGGPGGCGGPGGFGCP